MLGMGDVALIRSHQPFRSPQQNPAISAEPGHLLRKCVATMKMPAYENSKPSH